MHYLGDLWLFAKILRCSSGYQSIRLRLLNNDKPYEQAHYVVSYILGCKTDALGHADWEGLDSIGAWDVRWFSLFTSRLSASLLTAQMTSCAQSACHLEPVSSMMLRPQVISKYVAHNEGLSLYKSTFLYGEPCCLPTVHASSWHYIYLQAHRASSSYMTASGAFCFILFSSLQCRIRRLSVSEENLHITFHTFTHRNGKWLPCGIVSDAFKHFQRFSPRQPVL